VLLDLGADPYRSYCLDEAVGFFGNMVENELNQCEGQGQDLHRARQVVLDSYFGKDEAPAKGLYADPAVMFGGVKA
jgi:hypothetical protein